MQQHIYLTGYRGSGKSTVAAALAQRLQMPWVDTDDLIESSSERKIADIFASDGEPVFRDLESEAIQAASAQPPHVIGLGGGAILRKANRAVLSDTGKTIWLDADADVLIARITGDVQTGTRRPSLTDQSMDDEVRKLLAEREPLYREAGDFRVDTTGQSVQQIVATIIQWLGAA